MEGGQDAAGSARAAATARRRTLLIVAAANVVTPLASTTVSLLLPQLGRELRASPSMLGWVVTLYFLVFGMAVPLYGRLGDVVDTRRLFAGGILTFALGSLVCAVAPGYPMLMVGRATQALGTAAVVGLGGALVARAYPPERRGAALGTMAGIGAIAVAASAPIGGWLAELGGWRLVFALSAAAALLAPLALRMLPQQEPRAGARLDVVGGALLGSAVGGALLVMTEAARGVWAAPHVAAAAAGAIAAAVLLVVRQRRARSPFMPRELLANRRYLVLLAITFLVAAGDLMALIGVPLVLDAHGASAGHVGVALVPGMLLMIVLTPVAGRVVDSIGAVVPLLVGISAMLAGTLLLSVTGGTTLGSAATLMAVQTAGLAVVGPALMAPATLVVPPRMLNTASGLTEMSFYLGAGAGTAALTAVLAARTGAQQALNPIHMGAAPPYADAFGVALLPLLAALLLAWALGRRKRFIVDN